MTVVNGNMAFMAFNDYQAMVEEIDLAPEHVEVLRRARKVGADIVGPAAKEVDTYRRFPREAMDGLHTAGLTALYVPKALGGMGISPLAPMAQTLIQMEVASWCSSTSQLYGATCNTLRYISMVASPPVKEFFQREALQGHFFAAFGAESNTDKFAIKSKLEGTADGYRLNGRKNFATSSTGATWAGWVSITPDGEVVMPIVDIRSPGITVIDNWNGVGQCGTGSGVVEAEMVAVPSDHVLKTNDPGFRMSLMENAVHLNFAAIYAGIAMGAYREALTYVREKARPWRGLESATQDPYLRLRVADMATKIKAARIMVINAAKVYEKFADDAGADPVIAVAVAQAKVIAAETALDVTSNIFQVMGASSATTAHGFDRYFRDARTITLHDPIDRRREYIGTIELGSDRDLPESLLSKKNATEVEFDEPAAPLEAVST